MKLKETLFTIFLNIIIVNQASAFSAEIYKDNNITINKINSKTDIDSFTDKINPIENENKEGIKRIIGEMPTSFTGNITIRGADKGCFNSNIDVYSFDKNKQIKKEVISFKRNENPYPATLSSCLFGNNTMPEYVSKFKDNLFFISKYGVSYYSLKDNKKIILPFFLKAKEQKESIIYTLPYYNNLIIVVDNINFNKDIYEVILNQ